MKTLLLFLLSALPAFGQAFTINDAAFLGVATRAGAPATYWQTNGGSAAATVALGRYDTNCWVALKFTNSTATAINQVNLSLQKQLNPTGNIETYLYSGNGDNPTALVATGGTLAMANITTGLANTASLSASLSANTPYWVVLRSTTTNTANYVVVSVGALQTPATKASAEVGSGWYTASARTPYFAMQLQ